MQIIDYADAEMMLLALAGRIADELETVLRAEPFATLAVPGGTTPGPVFDMLCAADIDWPRVRVCLTDERWVPESAERSNTRLLRQRLLTGRAAAATYLPLHADMPLPEPALAGLSAGLAAALPISVLLLGMGLDMHVASIFPGADRLQDALTGPYILVPMRAPGLPEPRVTLTVPVLNAAINRHIVIIGPEKRAALQAARHLRPQQAPVAAVLHGATVHWAER